MKNNLDDILNNLDLKYLTDKGKNQVKILIKRLSEMGVINLDKLCYSSLKLEIEDYFKSNLDLYHYIMRRRIYQQSKIIQEEIDKEIFELLSKISEKSLDNPEWL